MNNDVMIPVFLLRQIIDLLDYWDISKYDCVIQDDYQYVKSNLHLKLRKVELRDAYHKIIYAKCEDERHSARMHYLQLKNQIHNDYS